MATIDTHNLTRRFGNFIAVDHVDLSVAPGEIFGLLGPNAAGKSTTIRVLSGILRADAGEASILGMDLFTAAEQIKRRIGYVAQHFALYPDLTVEENITFYGSLYGVADLRRKSELLDTYDLAQFGHRRAGLLSGGYQRRLAMAAATMHDPDLIFLDEPTAGIDPVTRKELWDLFYSLAAAGKTLFVTTHYMEEAERCNRLAFLNRGRLVAQGTPQEIRSSLVDRQVYLSRVHHDPALTRELLRIDGVQLVNQFGGDLRIVTHDSITAERLHQTITRFQPHVGGVVAVEPSIEDAFMAITASDEQATP